MPRLKAPERRQQLIDVATKLFAKYGYDATTTAAIAKAAGITALILYRHFKNKQAMFIAIVQSVTAHTRDAWTEIAEQTPDAAERIRLVAKSMPQHIREYGEQYHVLHGALAISRDKKVLAVLREHYAQMETFFREVILDGQKSGKFRKDIDAQSGAWQIIYSGIGFAMIVLNLNDNDHRGTVDDVIASMLRGLSA